MKVTKVDPSMLTNRSERPLSPREQARRDQEQRIDRMLRKLTGPDVAFRVRPEGEEKLSTIEARIRSMASERNLPVMLRRMENSVVVGLRNGVDASPRS